VQVSNAAKLPLAQRVVPGTQMRGRHTPSRQLSVLPQGMVVLPCPSALQTVRAEGLAHAREVPGMQVKGVQALVIALQPLPEGHAVIAPKPSPSGLQVCTAVGPAQRVVPAVHDCITQLPLAHDCPAGHIVSAYPSPSGLQVSKAAELPMGHRRVPATQTRETHSPSRQLWLVPQGMVV
jgi:hypothetical protein